MKRILLILILILMYKSSIAQSWLDTNEYPFQSNYFTTDYGKLHFIDEGKGDVILFVHGTPTWSFLYRNYIKAFSKTYRCVALDHIGFGLSDKPKNYPGTPQEHAKNLNLLIEHLNLKNITLVVHDFGGPIGMSYALSYPENVKRIVMFNTWLWETKNDKDAQKIDENASFRSLQTSSYFKFNYDNDYFANRDRDYTQGYSFSLSKDWLKKNPINSLFINLKNTRENYALTLEHIGFTPDNYVSEAIQFGDRPFSASLLLKSIKTAVEQDKKINSYESVIKLQEKKIKQYESVTK